MSVASRFVFVLVMNLAAACAPQAEPPGIEASGQTQSPTGFLKPVRAASVSSPPSSSSPSHQASFVLPPVPSVSAASPYVVDRYVVTGKIADALPAAVLDEVDAAFAGRFDLYAQASAPATIVAFSEAGHLVGVLLITNKHLRHLVGRAPSESGLAGWYDVAGARTDDGPMMGRPLQLSRISSRFGERFHPLTGEKKEHRGVDYAAPRGTPIHAVMDGVVQVRGTDASAGNHLKLRNGSYESWYLHLDHFADGIAKGEAVKKGAVVGFVGTTGASTGPHLHYELHLGPVVLDPLEALPLRSNDVMPPSVLAAHQERLQSMQALAAP